MAQSINDFTARADVVVSPGAAIVRAALPPSSIAALRNANGGDLRVFNGSGQPLPHALIDASTETQARPDVPGQRFAALSIYAARSATTTTTSTPTLRIEEGPTRRVIEYSSAKPATPVKQEPRGLLFDTRKIDVDVHAVELEGTLPMATIIKVTLDISADLKSWRMLASDAPLFDFGTDATGMGPSNRRITLSVPQNFRGQYVRLSWNAPGGPQIVAMKTVTAATAKTVQPTVLELGAPASVTDNATEWTLSSALRASGLRLQTTVGNALMPVRILTRARAGDPWQPVASTVVYRLAGTDGTVGVNPSLPLNTTLSSQLRVEALRGYNLTGVPLTLAIEHPPLQVLFITNGEAPFSIATGKAGVVSTALPVSTLIPGYKSGAEFTVPLQQTMSAAVDLKERTFTQIAKDSLGDLLNRPALLWAVLGLAVLILVGLAASLLRSPKPR